jgi:hypothetical protein
MQRASAFFTVALALSLVACGNESTSSSGSNKSGAKTGSIASSSPTEAGVVNAPIMQPFQGHWRVNEVKTIAAWRAAGRTDAEINQVLAMSIQMKMPLHPDMIIQGNVAIVPTPLGTITMEGEYLFFALHTHGPWVCGKSWHHEDRHDPGDMDKPFARLKIENGDLHFTIRSPITGTNPNDPDILNMPLTRGSAATCTADTEPQTKWSPWSEYVFTAVTP